MLGVIWFFTYGIGTTWQLVHERNPSLPPFTCWTIITQGFANGAGAAAGWVAAYMLWVLWTEHRDRFDLGYAVLFGIALLGITGWLPRWLMGLFGGKFQ